MNPTCTLDVPSGILPNRPFDIELRYKNQTQATVEVRLYNGKDKNRQFKTDGKLIEKRDYTLGDDSLNVARRAENLPTSGERKDQFSLPAGHYIFIARTPQRVAVDDIEITSLRLFLFELPSKESLAFVGDIETGRPVPNATVVVEDYSGNNQQFFACNAKGEVIRTVMKGLPLNVIYWCKAVKSMRRTAICTARSSPIVPSIVPVRPSTSRLSSIISMAITRKW